MTGTTTISGLPDASTPLTGEERVPMDDLAAGVTKDAAIKDIAAFGRAAAISGAISALKDEEDPFPQYQTQAEGDARYAPIGSAGTLAYVHPQPTPATTWTINHNLGYYPSVEVFNAGMQEIDAEIAHPSTNQTVITLNPATAGLARLI